MSKKQKFKDDAFSSSSTVPQSALMAMKEEAKKVDSHSTLIQRDSTLA